MDQESSHQFSVFRFLSLISYIVDTELEVNLES